MTKLRGETIIYFGPEPWEGLWRNRHQLMSRFAEDNDVWYVEPPAPIRDVLGIKRRDGTPAQPLRGKLCSRDESGVRIFHGVWWLPTTGRKPLEELSIRLFLWAVKLVARVGRKRKPIVWYSRPNMVHYIGKLHEKFTIYHVVDEYSGYRNPSRTEMPEPDEWEIELMQQADAVIVVTPTLYELKSPHNENTQIVANAADYESYSADSMSRPDDMPAGDKPVIGYSGLVAARLDLALLDEAAKSRPDWQFVFVGTVNDTQCEDEIRQLGELPNVHLLGNKPADEVARYVRCFDVCVIPYVVNLRARHASPLKLFEYAAACRPIVTTDFPAARAFEGHVRIASDPGSFVAACEEALALDKTSKELADNRDIASRNTWDHRVKQVSGIITQALD